MDIFAAIMPAVSREFASLLLHKFKTPHNLMNLQSAFVELLYQVVGRIITLTVHQFKNEISLPLMLNIIHLFGLYRKLR